tara:strand:- start:2931 stop:3284 length:354 start_codon:yes stop_codon:yes gene_type:complete
MKPVEQEQFIPEFEDRINNPHNYPSIDNGDGTISTHRMAAEIDEATGKWYVFPTIVALGDGQLHAFEDNQMALWYALRSGNNYEMDKESALAYASGGYKKGTPLDPKFESLESEFGP